MKFSLTYDLVSDYKKLGYSEEETAEFDKEETIEAIETAINYIGYETERIGNIYALVDFLSSGKKTDIVFNIAEGMHGMGREAQIPALLDAYKTDYVFSDTVVMALTLHKGFTKNVIRDFKIPTAPFCCVSDITEIDTINLRYPLFAKPAAEGTGKGVSGKSLAENRDQLESAVSFLLEKFRQPVLVEEFLPGREFTVGITGTGKDAKTVGGMEILYHEGVTELHSYENKANCSERVIYSKIREESVESRICALALDAWKVLGCRDGGRIDIRYDRNNVPNFIEVNPLAGLNPEISDLPIICRLHGIKYNDLIKAIVDSALDRRNNI